MPQKSKLNLPPLNLGKEPTGKRIARLRKEKGYTQTQLAKKIGITQPLVSAYELGSRGLSSEMTIRFALALEAPTDKLLGLSKFKNGTSEPSLKILKRLNKIEKLPPNQQKSLLTTIDTFLKGAEK